MFDKVATGSYYGAVVEPIKIVGIKHLKNNLSVYIREVKRGTRILVTDRDQVVAELREPLAAGPTASVNPLLDQWVREGKIRLPLASKTPTPPSPIRSPAGTAERLIDEDRGD